MVNIKPKDDDLCLDCYGAQIDLEEKQDQNDKNTTLDNIFISSRNDNKYII